MIKIGFVLLSSTRFPAPSTRITVQNMLPYLRAAGFDPQIVFEQHKTSTVTPDISGLADRIKLQQFQIVVFQKVFGDSVLEQVYALRQIGIKTVFFICDYVEPAMCDATDATVAISDYLKSLYPKHLHAKISVVHDGLEQPAQHKVDWGNCSGSVQHPLRAVLVTSQTLTGLPILGQPPPWLNVKIVGRYSPAAVSIQRLRENQWQLSSMRNWDERWNYFRFLANRRITCEAWGAQSVYQNMAQSDIGIIPIEPDAAPAWDRKSENRLTLKMAMGLPVIATPIPSYRPVIEQGKNGFLAQGIADWHRCLDALRDPELRKTMGQQARATALSRYSMERQAEKLIDMLRNLVAQPTNPPGQADHNPTVSI